MREILKYIISTILLFLTISLSAQKNDPFKKRQVFVRAGIDLMRFSLPFTSDYNINAFELSIDTEVKYRFFPTFEYGFEKINNNTETQNYSLNGNYFRIGFNYNMVNYKHRLDRNIFFIGASYGFSSFLHKADRITISNQWGDINIAYPETSLSANWLESVIGVRAELITNFYMGFTIRIKTMLKHTNYTHVVPYRVPGFGEGTKNIAYGLSYSVFYAIPLKNNDFDFQK
jgi:hypothetical protein